MTRIWPGSELIALLPSKSLAIRGSLTVLYYLQSCEVWTILLSWLLLSTLASAINSWERPLACRPCCFKRSAFNLALFSLVSSLVSRTKTLWFRRLSSSRLATRLASLARVPWINHACPKESSTSLPTQDQTPSGPLTIETTPCLTPHPSRSILCAQILVRPSMSMALAQRRSSIVLLLCHLILCCRATLALQTFYRTSCQATRCRLTWRGILTISLNEEQCNLSF